MFKIVTLIALVLVATAAQAQPLRDPTSPLRAADRERAEPSVVLHSILSGRERKLAVINGAVLKEGEPIPAVTDARLEKIETGYVVISQAGQTRRLQMFDSEAIDRTDSDETTTGRSGK